MEKILPITLLISGVLMVTGCQSETTIPPSPERSAVSSIPWNKPASWEGSGALGGFMPQGAH
jgi:hypothetical protein